MRGASVCRVHGGSAIQVRNAAKRRLVAERVEGEVRDALAYESFTGVANPLESLSRLADESLAMKENLAGRINALEELRYSAAGSGTEQLRAEVALYERALDRTARFLDMLVRSGFEAKRVELQERQGVVVIAVLHRIFAALDLTEAQQALIPVVVPREFQREIEAPR
jgi:hypothetical protein